MRRCTRRGQSLQWLENHDFPMRHVITMTHTVVPTFMGRLMVATDGHALTGVWFEDQKHAPAWPLQSAPGEHPLLSQAVTRIQSTLAGDDTPLDLPLSTTLGTTFQRQVWQQVSRIARGQVRTYADIAQALGRPQAARAVGAAIGRNPWLILVPCHRVLGQGGQLTGYAAGLARKQALLQLEGHAH